jgi:hypothetical protein
MAKQAWQPTLDRTNTRFTFQKPLAERQTQQMRIGRMAADLFAMEALAQLVWHLADEHRYDIRMEAAIAKLFCSERTIQFLKDAQIIFGGMGYETAESKRLRGAPGFGIEQLVRDAEMYRIGEGATDVLRPFVAREGLNPHLERVQKYVDERMTSRRRIKEVWTLLRFYVPWYFRLWRRTPLPSRPTWQHPELRPKLQYIEHASRRLARVIAYAMALRREALRDDQGRQNRIETAGEHLLTIAATAWYAEKQERALGYPKVWELANAVFRSARAHFEKTAEEIVRNQDDGITDIGKKAVGNSYPFLTSGIIARGLSDYEPKATDG